MTCFIVITLTSFKSFLHRIYSAESKFEGEKACVVAIKIEK